MPRNEWNCACCGRLCNTKHPCRRKKCVLGAQGKDMTMEPDMEFKEIGEKLGITKQRVSQIYDLAMAKVAYQICLQRGREMDRLELIGITP